MSALLDSYYDDIFSESGISVTNAVTTILVDGEKLESNANDMYLFQKFGIASVYNYVNIRSEASIDSEIVGRLYNACIVTIEGVDGEWTKIMSDSIEGYVKSEYLKTVEDVLPSI